jgi:outer membrane protein, heavy metal efflux system
MAGVSLRVLEGVFMRARLVAPLVLGSVLCVSATAHSQADAPLDLRDAFQEALRANPELIALQRQYEATRATIPEARSLAAPMFETQIWGWPVTTLNPSSTDMYMFMAEQELPGRGKRAAREVVAAREADLSRDQLAVRVNRILNEVKQAFAELLLAQATADLYRQQRPVLEDTAETATVRYASGHSGQHDTVKSIVELARLASDEIQWRERSRIAQVRLNVLLGRPPDLTIAVASTTDAEVSPLADLERMAVERHPEIAAASTEIGREEAELARLRGERRPDFVFGGGYMLQPGGAGAWTARGAITWPNAPWARGGLNTRIDAQEKRLTAARAQRDAVITGVRRQVSEARVHVEAAQDRIRVLEASVIPHIEHAWEVTRIAYISDRGEFADLLDTQRLLLTTRMEVLAARADLARAVADLQMATGDIPENNR